MQTHLSERLEYKMKFCSTVVFKTAPTFLNTAGYFDQGSPTWCPLASGRLRACYENNINMISVFTLMNDFNFY